MHKPSTHVMVMAVLLATAALLRIADPQPVARLRLIVFDTYQRLLPREPDPAFPVRIADIDEASLKKLGQWPWPRTKLAEMVERLKRDSAKVIALDLILAEPDRLSPADFAEIISDVPEFSGLAAKIRQLPSNDERLARALGGKGVVLGVSGKDEGAGGVTEPRTSFAFAGDDPKEFVPRFASGIANLPVLSEQAEGVGAVNWLPTHDQVVRTVPSLVTIGGMLYPSLALEALRVGSGLSTILIKSSGGSGIESFGERTGVELIRVGENVLETTAAGELWLRFSPSDPRRYIPAHRILDGSYGREEVAGRYILIGASATGLMDLRATPLQAAVPGVEIHAQAIEQMLGQSFLFRPAYATGAELAFLTVIGGLVAWLIRRYGPLAAAVIGVAALTAVTGLSWTAYANAGILFDPIYPGLAVLIVYLGGSLFNYVKSEADKNRVRSAFSHYVAPQLVEELALNHDKLKLGGEMREVTLLFSDVRGFSKIAEGLSAEELIQFINALFTPLSDIILEERGTIDKFMGDAVMAFWNAPVRDQEHATNACRAALRMMQDLDRINAEWAAGAAAADKPFDPVRIGIGLNTGACCVGNVGSPQRFDYSLLGDPVNIASRLEGETKVYGVPIIAGERTVDAAPGFAFLPIGSVNLRGKELQVRTYALLGDEHVAEDAQFRTLLRAHTELVRNAEARNRASALQALKRCRDIGWPGLSRLYDALESECSAKKQ